MQVTVRQDKGQIHFTSTVRGCGRPRHAHVPRWHFDMVLDDQRNTAYQTAITRAVHLKLAAGDEKTYVLDMGAGSGILSLIAARSAHCTLHDGSHVCKAGWPLVRMCNSTQVGLTVDHNRMPYPCMDHVGKTYYPICAAYNCMPDRDRSTTWQLLVGQAPHM